MKNAANAIFAALAIAAVAQVRFVRQSVNSTADARCGLQQESDTSGVGSKLPFAFAETLGDPPAAKLTLVFRL